MVRVISVHHFVSQHIQTVEQPTACTVAPPDKLLLALTSNCVEVRDLAAESDVQFTFPTVDEVIQILHCCNGDYVATLETKFNRQNRETNFVRVYINWDSVATLQQSKMTSSGVSLGATSECGMVQPMRARIAGRVTPTTSQSEVGSLEMVEIPMGRRNPNFIACCQVSGNLAVLSHNFVTLFKFRVRHHDISKVRFVDFEEMDVGLAMPFVPAEIQMCEDYLAAMCRDGMYLCRVVVAGSNKEEKGGEEAAGGEFAFVANDEPIDFGKLKADKSKRITINLPKIQRDNSIIHKNSPFTFCDKEMTAKLLSNSALSRYKIDNLIQLKLVPILVENNQRQITEEFKSMILKPLYIDENLIDRRKISLDDAALQSPFVKCLNGVVCMVATQQEGYLHYFGNDETNEQQDNCIAVYPFTAQVHHLVMEDYFLHALTETGLETYTLRFAHKMCHQIEVIDNVGVACPSLDEPICLVGLRPFLGVEKLLLASNSHLILLANSADNSSPTHSVGSNSSSNASYWTLYNLELPSPKMVFNDVSIVANSHRFTSTQTYCHLMGEAHIILRLALILKQWQNGSGIQQDGDGIRLVQMKKRDCANDDDVVVETYRTSCALLADHYIMCANEEEYVLALPYYKMARIAPFDVLKRVKKIQEQCNNQSTKGLLHYLKVILMESRPNWETERFLTGTTNSGPQPNLGSKQKFASAILDILQMDNYGDLANLILKSHILREYSTDKLIGILSQQNTDSPPATCEKLLALTILYIQKCNTFKSQECLNEILSTPSLCANFDMLIKNNWELLLETNTNYHQSQTKSNKNVTTFSELAIILISLAPNQLAEILVWLVVQEKKITLNKLIKIFLEYLPSSIGTDRKNNATSVLQKTFEMYFELYTSKISQKNNNNNNDLTKIIYERGANEALKLLVRSYLSQLQLFQLKEMKTSHNHDNDDLIDEFIQMDNSESKFYFDDKIKKQQSNEKILFGCYRYAYLNKMAPFQIEITSKLYEAISKEQQNEKIGENEAAEQRENFEADHVLKKLQAILCSPIVSKQILGEVNAFLCLNENLRGNLSLQTILLSTTDAVQLLIDVCPQCLLQFGRDRFSRTDEWKFLIATVQRRILRLSQNEMLRRVCFFHKKLLKDILTYVAQSMTLDQLVQVFPQRFSNVENGSGGDDNKFSLDELDILNEIQNYEPYVTICRETMHANQINKLITTTGQQLLCTLNL